MRRGLSIEDVMRFVCTSLLRCKKSLRYKRHIHGLTLASTMDLAHSTAMMYPLGALSEEEKLKDLVKDISGNNPNKHNTYNGS